MTLFPQGGWVHGGEGPEGGMGPLGRTWNCWLLMSLTTFLWATIPPQGGWAHGDEGPEWWGGPLGRTWNPLLLMLLTTFEGRQGGVQPCEGPEGGTGPFGRTWNLLFLMLLIRRCCAESMTTILASFDSNIAFAIAIFETTMSRKNGIKVVAILDF